MALSWSAYPVSFWVVHADQAPRAIPALTGGRRYAVGLPVPWQRGQEMGAGGEVVHPQDRADTLGHEDLLTGAYLGDGPELDGSC